MVSVIMPTYHGRFKQLNRTLGSFFKQDIPKENYELILIDDGFENDGMGVNEIKHLFRLWKNKLPLKYIFSGHRNKDKWIRRNPGFALNIGVKQAQYDNIILTCSEIYLHNEFVLSNFDKAITKSKNELIYCNGKNDLTDTYNFNDLHTAVDNLNTKLPFFLGLKKKDYINIGGYDEDFTGIGFDDTDFIERLNDCGFNHKLVSGNIIHLYHDREFYSHTEGYAYNKKLYELRKGIIKRNINREWGKIE